MTKNSGVQGKTKFAVARSKGAALRNQARAQRDNAAQLVELSGRPGDARKERIRLGESPDSTIKPDKPSRRIRRRATRNG